MTEVLALMKSEATTSPVPTTLNGFPVKMVRLHLNGYATVMVEREGSIDPYVVATWWPELKDTWSWGHYERNLDEANDKFDLISARNCNRGKV